MIEKINKIAVTYTCGKRTTKAGIGGKVDPPSLR